MDSTWAWPDRRPGSRHILRGRRRGCPLWCRKACNSDWSQGFQREWVRRSSSRYCPRRAILSATYCRSGTLSDVVSGFNYVLQTSKSTGRPSVALFAGGGAVGSIAVFSNLPSHKCRRQASTAIDNAVVSLTSAGVHVVVAAGGSNTGVENTSPARVPSAITVGATTVCPNNQPEVCINGWLTSFV